MAARDPIVPPHLPGTPPVVDEIEARLMREEAGTPLLPRRGTRPRLEVVAGRKAGKLAGSAVSGVTRIRSQVPVYKQRTQDFLQDASRRAREYAYAKPVNAVLVAAAAGFVIGFLLRLGRKRRG